MRAGGPLSLEYVLALWGGLFDLKRDFLNVFQNKIQTRAIRGPKLPLKVGESRKDVIRDVGVGSPDTHAQTKEIFGAKG